MALIDSETLIKEMQKAIVNLCNYDKSQVLSATNDTTPTPQNNGLGGLLPQKSVQKLILCTFNILWVTT